MKMVKKLLAVALAGVLALSVLTGCDKTSSVGLAEAMTTKFGATVKLDSTKSSQLDTAMKNAEATVNAKTYTETDAAALKAAKKQDYLNALVTTTFVNSLDTTRNVVALSYYTPSTTGVKGSEKNADSIIANAKKVTLTAYAAPSTNATVVTGDAFTKADVKANKDVTMIYSSVTLPDYAKDVLGGTGRLVILVTSKT